VQADGTVYIYTSNQNAQALRDQIATMLTIPIDQIVIRLFAGPGHYGRSNGGNAGGEDEAVILSKALGKPVRVQWTRQDDFTWSTQSAPALANVKIGLDAAGKMTAYDFDHYMPARRDDRPVGALLAGLPTMLPPNPKGVPGYPNSTVNETFDSWLYGPIGAFRERGYGTFQIGEKASALQIGLRNHSLRTPGHFQHNFPREAALNEAAALAGTDAIEFRLKHTDDERLKRVLETVRAESGWRTRPSPSPRAASTGAEVVTGQGVSVIYRSGGYWASVCQVSVTPSTGKVVVDRCTVVLEPGVVVNPMQLERQIEGGALMGVSHAMREEVTFDESGVTSRDWRTYPILTMAEVPEVKVVVINRPELGTFGQGSEAANAVAAPAIAAAIFDATGKAVRRMPFKPANVLAALKA
jgi:CO/xanthine dehydrogenase Mo-binding subunit